MYQFHKEIYECISWDDFKNHLISKNETDNHPHVPEEEAYLFSSTALESLEIDYLDLIYGIIRAEKPKSLLETGTFCGLSSIAIAYALKENQKFGCESQFTTLEIDKLCYEYALNVSRKLHLSDCINFVNKDSVDHISNTNDVYDFVLFDSSRPQRIEEFQYLLYRKKIKHKAILIFHDTSRLRTNSKLEDTNTHNQYLEFLDHLSSICAEKIFFVKSRGLSLFRYNL